MDINKILTANVLDLIFEGRFKEYGAYELRKTYNERLKKALIGMFAVTVLLAAGAIYSNSAKKSKTEIVVTDVSLTDVTQEKATSTSTSSAKARTTKSGNGEVYTS